MNQIVRFNPTGALVIPDHIASFFGEESNIEDRQTVPSLSYEGKVWTVSANGDKKRLMKTDENGDEAPVGTMRVVILDYAKRRGRALYEGTYDPAKPGKPTCYSEDGIKAHSTVDTEAVMQAVANAGLSGWSGKCDGCPMANKGSKINDNGKSVTACSQHRMLALVPANRLDYIPLRLKLSITSDWDGQSPDLEAQGWFAFSNFTSYLQKKGASHTAAFVTKMRFDPNVTWPKVMFAHDRWLDDKELAVIRPIVKSDEVKSLLAGTWTVTGVDGEKIVDPHAQEYGAAIAVHEKAVAEAKVTSAAFTAERVARETAAAKPAAPVAQTTESLRTVLMGEDDDAPAAPKPTATKAPKKTAAEAVGLKPPVAAPVVAPVTDPNLEALLSKWAMEDE